MFTKTAASIALAASAMTGVGLMGASSASADSRPLVYGPMCDSTIRFGETDNSINWMHSVSAVQKALNNYSAKRGWKTRVAVDGSFGNATRNLVIAVQRSAGLTPDGIVGVKTGRVIGIEVVSSCA